MTVESDILERIRPTPEMRAAIDRAASDLRAKAQSYLDEEGIDAEIMFVGSYAKDTFLSDPDLDLFVLFPTDVPKEDLERVGLRIGDEVLHGYRMYAEHPYTRGVFEGVDVDLVPCYHIKDTSKIMSPVDRSPFHARYVMSHMTKGQRDQVRLMKRFMKGIGAYGAEPNVRGFSGYMCEIMVLKYGTFDGVLEAASKWRAGTTVVIEQKGPAMDAPLVVYDPVDCKRNAASAVHVDTLSKFIVAAREYLAEPSERFFFPNRREPLSPEEMDGIADVRGVRIVAAEFRRPEAVEDNLWSQIWKTQYALARKLDEFGFEVERAAHGMDSERITIAFEIARDRLSKATRHAGPPVWTGGAEGFLKKWTGGPYGEPFIEDGVWNVVADRMYTSAEDMIRGEVGVSGIGRELDPATMRVLGHGEALKEADRDLLTELVDPRLPWKVRNQTIKKPSGGGRRG